MASNATHIPLNDIRTTGGTQPRAQLDPDTVHSYAEDMRGGAQFPPVIVYYDGAAHWLVDGFHRVAAARLCGLAEIAAEVVQGSLDDAQWHSYGVNATHGLRRTNADKRRAVEAALRHPRGQGGSNREIATHCGVSEFLVRQCRTSICDKNADSERTVTRNGNTYTMDTANIGKPAPITRQPDPDYAGDDALPFSDVQFDPDDVDYSDPLGEDEDWGLPRTPATHSLLLSSESNEWYTPHWLIAAAREALDGIDLDPASCDAAQETVGAARYYTIADDGLGKPWHGSVWLNPPYGRAVGEWVARCVDAYAADEIAAALILVRPATDTDWFQLLWDYPLCFIHGRVGFDSPTGTASGNTGASVVAYLGPDPARFAAAFGEFGAIMERVRWPTTFRPS